MGLHEALRRASAMSAFTNSQGPGQTPAEAERCWPGLPGSIMALQHMKPRTGVRHRLPTNIPYSQASQRGRAASQSLPAGGSRGGLLSLP